MTFEKDENLKVKMSSFYWIMKLGKILVIYLLLDLKFKSRLKITTIFLSWDYLVFLILIRQFITNFTLNSRQWKNFLVILF